MSRRFRICMAKVGRESARPSYGRPKLTLISRKKKITFGGVPKTWQVTILTLEQNPPERKFLTYINIFSQEDFALFCKIALSISISISIFSKITISISIAISIFLELPYRYRYFSELPYRYRYFQLLHIDIDIDIFQKCRYIDNRYVISIWVNCYCWGNSSMVEGRFSRWF